MPKILFIETATKVCSVGVCSDGSFLSVVEDHQQQYSHSSQLTQFITQALKESHLDFIDLDAVAVSKGPGSYTGLRIGVSTAKGICYAKEIPLIAIDTLEAMAHIAFEKTADASPDFFVPMIDARRMEVYNAVFSHDLKLVRKVRAEIIEQDALAEFLKKGHLIYFGDGAEKCQEFLQHPHANYMAEVFPGVEGMLKPALKKWQEKQFESVAYFEPFYLKDFVAGKPKVKGLH